MKNFVKVCGLALVLGACGGGDDDGEPDSLPDGRRAVDGRVADATPLDGPASDAPLPDAALPDAPLPDAPPPDAPPPDAAPTPVERGERIASIAGCAFAGCHSESRQFVADPVPFCGAVRNRDFFPADPLTGHLPAANLTNHATGLASYTDDEIERAVRDGIGKDLRQLHWSMPYYAFNLFTDQEIADLIAYLRTIPACDNDVAALRQAPGFVIPAITPMTWADLPQTTLPPAAPNYASAQVGRQLIAVGTCIQCHSGAGQAATATGITTPFVDGYTKLLLGARAFGPVVSVNLTPDATGILGWLPEEVRTSLNAGLDIGGQYLCGAMTSFMGANADHSFEDMLHVGHYLTTIPPVANATGTNSACTIPAATLVIGPGGAVAGITNTQDFGTVAAGSSSADVVFRVTNASSSQTSGVLGAAVLTGDFVLGTDGCVGLALPPTGKVGRPQLHPGCTITAHFTPTATGARTGTLAVTGTPGGTITATLSGTGGP